MKVYVVMGNGLPYAVFSTKDAADDYVAKRKLENNPSGDGIWFGNPMVSRGGWFRRIHWRHYNFELDQTAIVQALRDAVEALRSSAGPEEKMNAIRQGRAVLAELDQKGGGQ
jgi:hypothetical protein